MSPICKDDSVSYLNSLGYNVIRLPREGIGPLTVVVSAPNSPLTGTVFGQITDLGADPHPPLPTINQNLQAATINGLKTSRLELGLGITFLTSLLSVLGAGSASIEAAFKDAEQIEFEYNNVVYDTATPASIAKFLRSAKPDLDQSMLSAFDADGKAYIIVDVLKSNSFYVRSFKEAGGGVDINIGDIKEAVGANSKIVIEKKEDLKIAFSGDQALAFAIKVCPFWIETVGGKTQFVLRPQTAMRDIDVRGAASASIDESANDEDVLVPVLFAPNQLIRLV